MRLFIAVALPPDMVRAVASVRVALEKHGAKGRFVSSENYHVTLRFLGESDALNDAVEAMRVAARDIRPFVLRLGGYGRFGGNGAHTAFLAVTCDSEEVYGLYESLESALWERGFSHSRGRLTLHITLGRNVTFDEGFAYTPPSAAFTVNEITLYQSERINGRMRYAPLHRERLS